MTMKYWARVNADGVVVDTFAHDTLSPAAVHAPEVAEQFVTATKTVAPGYTRDAEGKWHAPGAAPEPEPAPPATTMVVDVPTFLMRLTPFEEAAIRGSDNPVVKVLVGRIDHPQTRHVNLEHPSVQEAIGYIAGLGAPEGHQPLDPPLIDAARVAQILAPEPIV